jgi:hypothetical protein
MVMNTYSKNGHHIVSEPHVDFDYDAIDASETSGDEPSQQSYAEAASRYYETMQRILGHILSAQNSKVAAWQVAVAMGSHHCEGLSQTEIAANCGVTRAALSAGAVKICRSFGWPDSRYMKSTESRQIYSNRRRANLKPAA